jgi:pimeloyl-ACP methyl ester carboxylesterase
MSTDRTTSTAGIRIRTIGEGPGLVLLHGGGVVSSDYRRLATAFAERFTVHLYDRRGRPEGPPIAPNHTVEIDVDDLGAVLEHTGATRIFGHSGGGFIAMQAGLRLPLTHLAVYDPAVSIDHTISTDWLPRFERALEHGDRPLAMALAGAGAAGGEGAAAALPLPVQRAICAVFLRTPIGRRMGELLPTMATEVGQIGAHDGPATDYAGVSAEVLLAFGARSATYFSRACNAIARALPHAEAMRIPRAGHNAANIGHTDFARPFADFLMR